MPSDRSRTSDDLRQAYKAVVTQQGRVILDRDFNAMQDIINGELAADATDIIGPCGTPDNGFQISLESASSPPTLWNPPSPLGPPAVGEEWDFLIAPGTMYVGGQRAVFPAYGPGQTEPYTYSYFDQPDWINPPALSSSPTTEAVYLHLFEQEVSAVEDPDLLDVALGGPDTTQRVRLMRRVERCAGTGTCSDAASYWEELGFTLDAKTNRLLPQVQLLASYSTPPSITGPCDPVVTGGYLGADNQLIRVEIRNPNPNARYGSPFLLWGYDNASSLYRVTASGHTLTLAQAPVDTFHQPAQNQVVEVLRTTAILASDPNQADSTQPIVRCVAEARGFVTTLSAGYSPNADGSGGTVVLADALPPDYANSDTPLFLRIWSGWQGKDQTGTGITSGQSVLLSDYKNQSTGFTVTLSPTPDATGTLPDGAFWMMAVRPSTPQAVYPERFLESPQSPDGPRQWMCPLAVIDWTGDNISPPAGSPAGGPNVQNCRQGFDNLVTLTAHRSEGCCTVRVVPEDAQKEGGLQAIIDQAVSGVSAATICFAPGTYWLPQPLRLGPNHSNLTMEGCQPGAVLAAAKGAESGFLDGLVVLSLADNVTLGRLTFNLPMASFMSASGRLAGMDPQKLATYGGVRLENLYGSVGVRPLSCNGLAIRECTFTFPVFSPAGTSKLVNGFAAGILSSGACSRLDIEANNFNGPTQSNVQISSEPFQFLIGYAQTPVSNVREAALTKHFAAAQAGIDKVAQVQSAALKSASRKAAVKKSTAAKPAAVKADAAAPAAPQKILVHTFQPIFQQHVYGLNISGTLLPSTLQDAVFRDNVFSGLTLAVFVFGPIGSLRVESNEVQGSYAGFWFFSKQSLPSSSQIPANHPELLDAIQDPVVVVGSAIARGYPLPSGFSDPSQVQLQFTAPPFSSGLPRVLGIYDNLGGIETNFESQAAQSASASTAPAFNFSLRCSGNRADAEVFDADTQSSGAGLIAWADETAPSSETLLSGNHITNNGLLSTSVPTVMLVSLSSCTITGNQVSNLAVISQAESLMISYSLIGSSAQAPSFNSTLTGNIFVGLVFSESVTITPAMAVAGNVFDGGLSLASGPFAITGNVFQNNSNWPVPPPWPGANSPVPGG